jgi:hypothetical protein
MVLLVFPVLQVVACFRGAGGLSRFAATTVAIRATPFSFKFVDCSHRLHARINQFGGNAMSRSLLVALVATVLLLGAAPVAAHHSEAAEFDDSKPVKVTGEVRKVEWKNPHIWYYVEGTDEITGRTAVWGFSGGAPNSLRRRGVSSDALQIGDVVIVEGHMARDGSANASGSRVTFGDGSSVFTASAQAVGQQQ